MKMQKFIVALSALVFAGLSAAASPGTDDMSQKIMALDWQMTTAPGNIAGKATFKLDGQNLMLLDAPNTNKFLTLQGNLPMSGAYTVAKKDFAWFSVLKFLEEGYVKDDEKIDAEALLKTMKEANAIGNEERKSKGLPGLYLEGWQVPPHYDSDTKRLEWGTLLHNDNGAKIVNYSTKILGRRGHMDVILVSAPKSLDADLLEFKRALKGFDYIPTEGYSEFRAGDKVAEYGLGALVLGGAAALATKKGLWAVLGGLLATAWKFVAGIAIVALASIKRLFFKKKPD